MNQFETSLTGCFVAPLYCKQLLDLGLSFKVPYFWKIYGEEAELLTHYFDLDNYYIEGMRAQDFITTPDLVLPAYTIDDVGKIIPPDWGLMFSGTGDYQLMPSDLYPVEGCTASRMPDVFAKHLVTCIRKHVVDLDKINSIIAG